MEAYKEEALRAKENAEKRFYARDYAGAKDYATKAQMIYPNLDGISQMLTAFNVYIASEIKVNGEPDCYSILGLDPSVGKVRLKKQYRKMAAILHPDKNKTLGAEGAFKLVSDAWLLLSDTKKRRFFDRKRKKQMSQAAVRGDLLPVSHGLDTFWTVCASCRMQYEYLRKYLNKKLSCKNCRGVFVAIETGEGPAKGAVPYSTWSQMPANIYNSEYVSNASYQWGSVPGAVNANGLITKSNINGKKSIRNGAKDIVSSGVLIGYTEPSASKDVRPCKKRKFNQISRNGSEKDVISRNRNEKDLISRTISEPKKALVSKPEAQRTEIRRYSAPPPFDARKLLMEKARAEIRKKLEELNKETRVVVYSERKVKIQAGGVMKTETLKKKLPRKFRRLELKRTGSMPINVPDSDFHDFDKDRSEDCFKPKQIWAIYDEDGMPRLYCIIREVISVQPFKIQISYLNAKTDTEFGPVKWVVFGFTKSCGSFRAFNSDIVEEVNLFSHLLRREKAGRGGCVKIYPRSGDIWAVYRNWSPNWNKKTPVEVRHRYEMVEILDEYSEELGICIAPLVKLDRCTSVYKRVDNKDAIRWISRGEMLRFSHQVPSWRIEGGDDFTDGCWDLDPAAMPNEMKIEDKPFQDGN